MSALDETRRRELDETELTLALKALISSSVRVSLFAMTGMRLTFWCRRRMNSMSMGLRLKRNEGQV